MRAKRGGEWADAGTYWSLTTGEFIAAPKEGKVLPGGREALYMRAPLPLAMMLGPLMGLAYVIFLPLSGFAMVAFFLGQKARKMAERAGAGLSRVAAPNWVPGVSYLLGKWKGGSQAPPATPKREEKPMGEALLTTLEKEIEERRRKEEKQGQS